VRKIVENGLNIIEIKGSVRDRIEDESRIEERGSPPALFHRDKLYGLGETGCWMGARLAARGSYVDVGNGNEGMPVIGDLAGDE